MEVVGYADRFSVRPGETIRFMVSCERSKYRAEIVRLIHGDPNPRGPGFKEKAVRTAASGEYRGRRQTLPLGSYAVVDDSPLLTPRAGFTITAWVLPTTPTKGLQGLVTKWDSKGGYGLFVNERGELALSLGDGKGAFETVSSKRPMRQGEWYFAAAAYDAERGLVRLVQQPAAPSPDGLEDSSAAVDRKVDAIGIAANGMPLLMAAYHSNGGRRARVAGHFNGKLEGPCLFSRALTYEEMEALAKGSSPASFHQAVTAAWDFSLDISTDRVSDTGPNRLHGCAVNMPLRATPGHAWTGRQPDWKLAPQEYGAIHFHDDDLEDAKWEVDFELKVPATMRSGVYAAKLATEKGEDYVPFFVRPAAPSTSSKRAAEARILFLVPTNSYLAYANEHVMELPLVKEMMASAGIKYPASPQDKYIVKEKLNSLYDYHTDGSYVHYSSRLRPIANMRPKYDMPALVSGKGSPHQFNADMHLVGWLEAKGHAYDLATDEDLHYEGLAALSPYKVVVTGSHPEYWSSQMLDAMEAYLANGGRLMYLGGNGFYWVTSFAPVKPHVVEVRKSHGTGPTQVVPGEWFHSTTGELGGIWRNNGRTPQKMLGVGFTAQGFDKNAPYKRLEGSFDPRAAFIFEGIGEDEIIGDFPSLVVEHGAGGFEVDRLDYSLGTPRHALLLATTTQLSDAYQHVREENPAITGLHGGTVSPMVRGDLVFFETPKGGGVFSVGSISWCGSLPMNNFNNNVSRLTDNVLRRFASDEPL
jgi:N,N-dimethylformamidase